MVCSSHTRPNWHLFEPFAADIRAYHSTTKVCSFLQSKCALHAFELSASDSDINRSSTWYLKTKTNKFYQSGLKCLSIMVFSFCTPGGNAYFINPRVNLWVLTSSLSHSRWICTFQSTPQRIKSRSMKMCHFISFAAKSFWMRVRNVPCCTSRALFADLEMPRPCSDVQCRAAIRAFRRDVCTSINKHPVRKCREQDLSEKEPKSQCRSVTRTFTVTLTPASTSVDVRTLFCVAKNQHQKA